MSLIVLERASLGFGAQRILVEVSLRIGERERIGLVGPNGAGKSTLLRVMMGTQALDTGVVRRSKACRIGYLPQDVQEVASGTLLRSVLATVPGRATIESRIADAEGAMDIASDTDTQMELATRLAELGEQLEHFERWYSERQAIRILEGLGFSQTDLQRDTAELSGGWKMRAALAGLLFQQPDVLFLDEPTNHLDLPSVLWLDGFLRELRGAVVLICHDRDFLNRHISRVVSFEPEGVRSYSGDYDAYVDQRDAEDEVLDASRRNRERDLKRAQAFVTRFRAKATKARQAQSRARRVKRLKAELEADKPLAARRKLSFSFPEVPRCGRDVVRIEGMAKAFGDLVLYDGLDQGIYAGDRIGIVGVNGAGKTTLLRLIAGELKVDAGTIKHGTGVRMGYYAQHHDERLHAESTVLDEVRHASPGKSETFLRGVCGAFLFTRDEVEKKVSVLSGGERARVLLARLLVEPGNLLLMDEPTNHLDVAAADALAEALDGYGGTLVFVSHNTTFVNRLATRIWDIESGELVDYPGRLDDYLESKRAAEEAALVAPATGPKPKRKPKPKPKARPTEKPAPPVEPRESPQVRKLKARIEEMRAEMGELESELADPDVYGTPEFGPLYKRFTELQAKVEQLEARL